MTAVRCSGTRGSLRARGVGPTAPEYRDVMAALGHMTADELLQYSHEPYRTLSAR
jgi:hypothetical protein